MTKHERAKVAAAARWSGERSKGVRIYVDEDAAKLIKSIKPKSLQRQAASSAIRLMLRHGKI